MTRSFDDVRAFELYKCGISRRCFGFRDFVLRLQRRRAEQGDRRFGSNRELDLLNWREAGPAPGQSICPMAGTSRSSAVRPMMS